MQDCIFCDIVAGKAPASIVSNWEGKPSRTELDQIAAAIRRADEMMQQEGHG